MRDVVARLVAVGILPDQPRDIGRHLIPLQPRIGREERIQPPDKAFASAHQLHQPLRIVGNKPAPLPGIPLAIVIVPVIRRIRIERLAPLAAGVQPPHEARGRIVISAVTLRKGLIPAGIGRVAQFAGQQGDTPVVVGILQRLGHGLLVPVAGHIAHGILPVACPRHDVRNHPVRTADARRVILGSTESRPVSLPHVEAAAALRPGIGHERNGMIADHRPRIV